VEILQGVVAAIISLKKGKLRSQYRDNRKACRISLFTQLLIKFRKQVCYSEGAKETLRLHGTPKFHYGVKNSTLFYLNILKPSGNFTYHQV
jgi:hypothetical protein